ncbi:hypothetical protein S7711_08611 [Stachybotrys chartarum IBT 7711]|uniref:Uncharacterized protein n=1 Tax=Stachybotrys chartarum (strain CBS 109288 / IBT 7711) TaxID=1280523 RepID=A0A084AWZ9_STACB|nr:hypothetical protein S7711_08611 [Stachybotrys chartarum IBT 7711]
MARGLSSPARQRLSDVLLGLTIAGGVVSTVLVLLQLIAGTDNGKGQPILKSLAPVSLNGILPNDNATDFLVHLRWFGTNFAWEYPTAPDGVPSSGFTPHSYTNVNVRRDFGVIAAAIDLPSESYDCPTPGPRVQTCSNVFFEACRSYMFSSPMSSQPSLPFIINCLTFVLAITVLFQEWAIKYKPYWMKCRCLILKKWCPCPNGTQEEIEALEEHAWDKVRLSYWALLMLWFKLSAVGGNALNRLFVMHVSYIDERLPEGLSVDPKIGPAYEVVSWGSLVFGFLSFVFILAKWFLSRRPKGWLEQQDLSNISIQEEGVQDQAVDSNSTAYKDTD